MPIFLFLDLTDTVLVGLKAAFLVFGLPVLRKVSPGSWARAWAIYLSIDYLIVYWWPHLKLHASNSLDLQGPLYIRYLFHQPLTATRVLLAYCFFSLVRS